MYLYAAEEYFAYDAGTAFAIRKESHEERARALFKISGGHRHSARRRPNFPSYHRAETGAHYRIVSGRIPPPLNPVAAPSAFRAIDVIRKKRDGNELSRDEITALINAYTAGDIPDYQVSAWLMAVVLRGMTRGETAALTDAMLHSGEVLDFSSLPGKKVDKHSTGGVGDKTSLVLAPLAAAAGVTVPMISGRGLGHTGGTLDKLEAIPGFNVHLSVHEFRRILETCGCAMIGQTAEIAPADRKLYALRDVTGTVESPYLICASIMSKKLAEGIDSLVLDVKTGSGAFMKNDNDAAFLAELMVETGERMGKQVVALITDMDQPLGRMVGNALEVVESVEILRGTGPEDLRQLCIELASWMLHLGGVADSVAHGKKRSEELIASGKALDKFRKMVELQGGDPRTIDDPARLPQAQHVMTVLSPKHGHISSVQCEQVGTACVVLGGGRERKEDSVDPSVGIVLLKKVGDAISAGEPLATIYYNAESRALRARQLLEQSFRIDDRRTNDQPAPNTRPLIHRVIGKHGDTH
jgi:pyrimidine-nucleoside phosphorylase